MTLTLSEQRKRLSKAVWVEIGQAGPGECGFENLSDGVGVAPMHSFESIGLE
jgi:hypothetical protein